MKTINLQTSHDTLQREVLYAVELIDPVTRLRVTQRMNVRLEGVKHGPIVTASGRFVWFDEKAEWPTKVFVDSRDPRFESQEFSTLAAPPDIKQVKERERLQRHDLQPTRVYDFGEGVTAIRGMLIESANDNMPIAGAKVSLAWSDTFGMWNTAHPDTHTDSLGQFALFTRLPTNPKADIEKGLLHVRLECERDKVRKVTRNFAFLGQKNPADRVPEGLLLFRDVSLGWSELSSLEP